MQINFSATKPKTNKTEKVKRWMGLRKWEHKRKWNVCICKTFLNNFMPSKSCRSEVEKFSFAKCSFIQFCTENHFVTYDSCCVFKALCSIQYVLLKKKTKTHLNAESWLPIKKQIIGQFDVSLMNWRMMARRPRIFSSYFMPVYRNG